MDYNKEVFSRIFVFNVSIKIEKVVEGHHLPTLIQVGTLFYNEADSQFYLSVVDDYIALIRVIYMRYINEEDIKRMESIMRKGELKNEWREDVKAWNSRNKDNPLDLKEVEVAARSLKCMKYGTEAYYGVWKMLYPLQIFTLKENEKKGMAEYYYRVMKEGFPKRKRGEVRSAGVPKTVEDIEERIREYYDGKKYRWDYLVRDPRETGGEISYGEKCNKSMYGFVLN